MKKCLYLLLAWVLVTTGVCAQGQPFYEDIQQFKKQDSISFPPKGAILFIGSSSFTLWKDVADYFPGHTIINRGFGGSTLVDVIRYADDIIAPYRPAQVVIYCGENDAASGDAVTSNIILQRFTQLFNIIRNRFPGAGIVYVSMKPSPSRRQYFTKIQEGNALIRHFLQGKRNTAYVDIYSKMLDASGQPFSEIFLSDSLHMNAKGYAIWQKQIKPHLLKK